MQAHDVSINISMESAAAEADKCLCVLNNFLQVKLTGHDTEGAYSLIESVAPPGAGFAPHIHAEEDESLYMIAGQLEVRFQNKRLLLKPGDSLYLPRHIAHSFVVVGDAPARFLITVTPAGLELYFQEMARLLANSPVDVQEIVSLSAEYGIRFVDATFQNAGHILLESDQVW